MAKRVVTVNAFSKTYAMTGWRLGYAGGPSEIVGQMVKLNTGLNSCPSSIAQRAGVEALRGPQDCVRRMREEYLRRRDFLLERLRRIPGLTCVVPDGAFYAFPNIQELGLSSFDFSMALLDQAKVSTVPGSAFGPLGEGYVRFSYANSIENLGNAMDRIEAAIHSGLKAIKK
jgi:aspartate/methionine/tyrosine aminotransferase